MTMSRGQDIEKIMIAGMHNFNTTVDGYIDSYYETQTTVCASDYYSEVDVQIILERYEKQLLDMRRLGAVVGFVWIKKFGCYSLIHKYWRIYRPIQMIFRILTRRPIVILAGFMPEARGRHWDRKSRRGEK